MLTWVIGTILVIYCLIRRFSKNGRVEGYPLGMPRGTVRAIITIMVVAFPFNYIPPFNFIFGETEIPADIINSIFILVAFYFEARKSEDDRLKLIREIRKPEIVAEEKKKEKKPLYLPKYSVRITLVSILIIYSLINLFHPLNLKVQNTLLDILIIVVLFFIGTFFRAVGTISTKKKLKEQIQKIPNYKDLSRYEIIEKLDEQKGGSAKHVGESLFSIIIFLCLIIALFFFTTGQDSLLRIGILPISMRTALLFIINIYYGFRD